MELHYHSYRKDEFTKMINSIALSFLITTNVYRFFYDIFNTTLLNIIGFDG